jgi:hypothetical protein
MRIPLGLVSLLKSATARPPPHPPEFTNQIQSFYQGGGKVFLNPQLMGVPMGTGNKG